MDNYNLSIEPLGATTLKVSWDHILYSSSFSTITCSSMAGMLLNHSISLKISPPNTTSMEVNYLIPATNYSCCLRPPQVCGDARTLGLSETLSVLLSGVIGGAAGFVVAALLVLALVGIIVASVHHCKKHKRYNNKVIIRELSERNKKVAKELSSTAKDKDSSTLNRTPFDNSYGLPLSGMAQLYDSALQEVPRPTSFLNLPPPITEDVGEKGIMEDDDETEQYELMLATSNNPAYKPVVPNQRGIPRAQIYDEV